MSKGSTPPIPQILTPATAVSLRRMPDNKGYALTVTLELEFPDREPIWGQHGFYLTDYELGPFLETVDCVRESGDGGVDMTKPSRHL